MSWMKSGTMKSGTMKSETINRNGLSDAMRAKYAVGNVKSMPNIRTGWYLNLMEECYWLLTRVEGDRFFTVNVENGEETSWAVAGYEAYLRHDTYIGKNLPADAVLVKRSSGNFYVKGDKKQGWVEEEIPTCRLGTFVNDKTGKSFKVVRIDEGLVYITSPEEDGIIEEDQFNALTKDFRFVGK